MKTTEELLPCPNDCKHGLVNVFEYPSGNPEESRDLYQVACACGVRGPMKDSRKAAVAAWNALPRRADIVRVEQERNWLAEKNQDAPCELGMECLHPDSIPKNKNHICDPAKCWLELAAKEATCQK